MTIRPPQMTPIRDVLTRAHQDFNKKLNAHAFFKLNDKETGEDTVQNTFMKTWLYLVKGGKIEAMRAFLFHILNGLIIDQYRKHKSSSLDVLMDRGFEPGTDESDRMFDILDGKAASQSIEKLPERYRAVMGMRYIKMLSLKEISSITGQTKNAVSVRLHRGLKKLKVIYEAR